MFRRREAADPLLAQLVEERFARLVRGVVPRRARVEEASVANSGPGQVGPVLEPSDDGWDEVAEIDQPLHPAWPADLSPPGASLRGASASGAPAPARSGAREVPEGRHGDRRRVGIPHVLSRVHLGVVVGILLVGVLTAGWAILRARPVAVATTPLASVAMTPAPGSASIPGATPAPGATPTTAVGGPTPVSTPQPARRVLLVHVLGAVRRPGVVSLNEGARVRDALAAAGGLSRAADPGNLNLAQVLTDGQQLVLGTKRHPAGDVRGGSAASTDQPSGSGSLGSAEVPLNSATQAQLELLPGVGPVMAGKILAWRQEHGRFSRIEELQEVDGIGPKTYAHIAPHVRI